MYMHDLVLWVLTEELFQCLQIASAPWNQLGKPKNTTTQRFNFIIIVGPEVPVNKEIKLHLGTINVAVVVHDHGFQTAAAHVGYNM